MKPRKILINEIFDFFKQENQTYDDFKTFLMEKNFHPYYYAFMKDGTIKEYNLLYEVHDHAEILYDDLKNNLIESFDKHHHSVL